MNQVKPNTFLIGAQKCATTSIYNWLSQHPEICGPLAVKDYEYFIREEYYSDTELLSSFYDKVYNNEKIILQGCVHYIYFYKALERIKNYNPNSKFILVIRNPIERAISAYHYAVKFNYESLPIDEAFNMEDERIKTGNIRTLSELTYKTHGLYYEQIKSFYEIFNKSQLHIIFYEEVIGNPKEAIKKVYNFLEVDDLFIPEFKIMNITGKVRNKLLQRVGFGDYPIRNFFVRKVLRTFLSEEKWAKLRFTIIHANTLKGKSNYYEDINKALKEELHLFFNKDIENLQKLLNVDLSNWEQ